MIALGRVVPVDQAGGEERVDDRVEVDQPEPDRDRHHQHERPLHGRVADVDHHLEPAVTAAQPGQRQQELDHGRDQDREGVDVELGADPVRVRDADHEPDDDRDVPGHRRERGHAEMLVAVEDPDDDPGQAEQHHDREQDPREVGSAAARSRMRASPTGR